MSDLDLNKPTNSSDNTGDASVKSLDFKQSDDRAIAFFTKQRDLEIAKLEKAHDIRLNDFIDKHPPLLWQDNHLEHFLKSIGVDTSINVTLPPVDDFIFMSAIELDAIFPKTGTMIYTKLRARFVDPNIKKLPKTKPIKQV
jgi:hypothetical protein